MQGRVKKLFFSQEAHFRYLSERNRIGASFFPRIAGILSAAALCFAITPTSLLAAQETAAPASDPKVITLRADPSCPSNCDPASDHPGYDVELAKAIFGAAGYKVDYRLLSWSRTLVEVRNGTIDGFVAGIKDDAPDFVFPEEPAGILENGFAVRKGSNWRWSGPDSLKGKILGYIPDYQYFPALKEYIDSHANNPKAVQGMAMMNATELNLRKLSVGRIDVTCDDTSVLLYEIQQLNLGDNLEVVPAENTTKTPNYIAFSPNSPRSKELAHLWDDGIRRLRANGELQHILSRYGLKDWK